MPSPADTQKPRARAESVALQSSIGRKCGVRGVDLSVRERWWRAESSRAAPRCGERECALALRCCARCSRHLEL